MLQAQRDDFVVSAESVELAWVLIEQLESYTNEESILRAVAARAKSTLG